VVDTGWRLGEPLLTFKSLDSTSAYLKRLAEQKPCYGTVVWALSQEAGYGQRGRTWVSPAGSGLYFSMLLPPDWGTTALPFVIGLGCVDALRVWVPELRLKWVNDLVCHGRKLGGILVEKGRCGVVVGIGINWIAPRTFHLSGIDAIGMRELADDVPDDEQVLLGLLDALARRLRQWQEVGFEVIRAEWSACSVTLGCDVRVVDGQGVVEGRAIALGEQGQLMIACADGTIVPVVTGTVRTLSGAYC